MTGEWNYIIAAYAVTWIGIGGYALHLRRLMRQAEQEYADARSAADARGRAS
jgi:CcmD family protein